MIYEIKFRILVEEKHHRDIIENSIKKFLLKLGTKVIKKFEIKRDKFHSEFDILPVFEDLWRIYPKKIGRKEAFKHVKASIRCREDAVKCEKAILNYMNSKQYKQGYIMNGSTFFNNWEDWYVFDEKEYQKQKKFQEFLKSKKNGEVENEHRTVRKANEQINSSLPG